MGNSKQDKNGVNGDQDKIEMVMAKKVSHRNDLEEEKCWSYTQP